MKPAQKLMLQLLLLCLFSFHPAPNPPIDSPRFGCEQLADPPSAWLHTPDHFAVPNKFVGWTSDDSYAIMDDTRNILHH